MTQHSKVHKFSQRFILTSFLFLVPLVTTDSFGGEIYGRLESSGKGKPNAKIKISCPSFSGPKTTSTDRNGEYRLTSGPRGEERCQISVSGSKNTVTIFTSKRRTKANLEIDNNRLRKR